MVSTLKETLDKMMRSLPVGGSIDLEINFNNLALSVKNERRKRSSSRGHTISWSRSPYRSRNFATETIGYCDDEDAYSSVDLRTEKLFPSAELVRKQPMSRASAKNRLRRAAERKIASRRKIAELTISDELLTKFPGVKTKEPPHCSDLDPRYDSVGAYSDLDLTTDSVFPSATLIRKSANSSSSGGSVFSSNASTYEI